MVVASAAYSSFSPPHVSPVINLELNCLTRDLIDYIPSRNPVASAMESLDTIDARTSLPQLFAWSHA